MRPIFCLAVALALPLAACGDNDEQTGATGTAGTTDETGPDPADTGATEPVTTAEPSDPTATTTSATTTTGDPITTGETTTTATTTAEPTTTTNDDTTGDPGAGESSDDTGPAQELPPTDSVEILEAWLAGGSYKTWAAESGVHPSTGPHGGNVRTFVNAIALDSLAAANAEHPQDSATVKELYGDGVDEILGYAVTLKTAPESQNGGLWYWYERYDATTYGGELGVGLCTGCHGGGADYILTPYPLQ